MLKINVCMCLIYPKVNYWLEGDTRCLGKHEETARFIRFYGDRGSGLIVGMEYALDYCLNLQFLNHAGLGPKTDNYYIGMNFARKLFPLLIVFLLLLDKRYYYR